MRPVDRGACTIRIGAVAKCIEMVALKKILGTEEEVAQRRRSFEKVQVKEAAHKKAERSIHSFIDHVLICSFMHSSMHESFSQQFVHSSIHSLIP